MRRRLIVLFLSVSTLVAVAFVVPLGFVVRRTAEDRAIDAARADAAAVVPALVSEGTITQIASAIGATDAGREGRMSVMTSQGWTIGEAVESERVDAALEAGASSIGPVDGGFEIVAAVATGPGELSAVRVFVEESTLRQGQWRAWGALAGVGVVLVGISVVVADRLSRTIVRPTKTLAAAAKRLGDGDLATMVDPEGPPELVELASTFNELGSRVGSMIDRERELVAELSHRLRTPLTKLRMRVEQVEDRELADSLLGDIDDVTEVVNALIAEARGSLDSAERCEAGRVVIERAEFWSVLAEDQHRPWRFEQGRGPLPVAVGESDLAAALDVVLENVFAHTDEGAALAVGFGSASGMARIWVDDGGEGILVADTVRGASTAGSTGLGLDIARRTAEDAGGSLEIGVSDLGGASVTILLPLVESQSE